MVFVFMKKSYGSGNDRQSMLRNLQVTCALVSVVVVYALIGAVAFRFINPQYASQGSDVVVDTTFVDALYFMTVTLTTVGFGDVVASDDTAKLFLSFYILLSLVLVGVMLDVTDFLFEIDIEELEEGSEEGVKHYWTKGRKKLAWAIFVVFLFIAFSVLFFVLHEDFTLVDAIYFSVVTLTTVGYGDITPKTTAGKWFSIFWIGLGCLALFRAVGALMDVMLERRKARWREQRDSRQEQLRRHISARVGQHELVNMSSSEVITRYTKQELIDVLTRVEFYMYRLQKDGRFSAEDISRLEQEFRELTVDQIHAEFDSAETSVVFSSMGKHV